MAEMCSECGAVEPSGATCAQCGHVFVRATGPTLPEGPEVASRWRRIERVTWAYMGVVGVLRFGIAIRDGSRRGWMLAIAAAMVVAVLWAMRVRHAVALKAWTLAVCAGAALSVLATLWAFGQRSFEGRAVESVCTLAVCAYAVELLRARRVIVGV